MNKSSESSSPKPSLESLLRLKRAERPDEAFWTDFEVGMRQKQLAAIVEPKPWWLGVSLGLRRFSIPALVVTSGAAALLAFTVVRNSSPVTDSGFTIAAVSTITAEVNASRASFAATSPAPSVELNPLGEIAPEILPAADLVQVASAEILMPVESGNGLVSALEIDTQALLANNEATAAPLREFEAGPFALGLTGRDFASVSWTNESVSRQDEDFVNLASMQTMDLASKSPLVAGSGSAVSGVEKAILSDVVVGALGSRFERLLSADASKVAADADGSLIQVRDRVLHHLGREEDLYASVSRLGLGGDRLSLRF